MIPAHDEESTLEEAVARLEAWAERKVGKGRFAIIVSENASKDRTAELGARLARSRPHVGLLSSNVAGKGGALKWGMSALEADRYVMMDADMSVDLESVGRMLDAASDRDIVIASRRAPGAEVSRPLFRRAVTATYGTLLNAALGLGVRDAQCGCKIVPRAVRDEVLGSVTDDGFFFDTELLARARKAGFGIREMPVRWEERAPSGRGSSVRIMRTSLDFLRRLRRLRKDL